MRFRFTLTHRAQESEPFVVPALSLWSTATGADEEWITGPIPEVSLNVAASEILYVDYAFVVGNEYIITLQHTVAYISGISNPRTVALEIMDTSFNVQFSQLDTFLSSPGGTDSVTISFTATVDCQRIGFRANSGSNVTLQVDEVDGSSVDPNSVTTSLEINEPDGWKQAVMRLERDKEFFSLIEFFDGSFIFYGNNGVVNGGIDFIKDLEETFGPDVAIEILIELAPDDETYETIFSGQLDLSLAEEVPMNKIRIPIIRDNFWAKFNSRWQTPVNLLADVDLDGTAITTPVDGVSLTMPSQIITYFSHYTEPYSITYETITGAYSLLNWSNLIRDDIKLFSIVRDDVLFETFAILGLFEAPYDGEFQIEIKLSSALYDAGGPEWQATSTGEVRIKKTTSTAMEAFGSTTVTSGADSWREHDINTVYKLFRGEQLSIALFSPANLTVFGTEEITWAADCVVATTEVIVLSGEQTIDGVLTSADRVLVKNQGNTQENGVYVSAAGAWSRATDMDSASELTDSAVFVTGGDLQAASAWRQTEVVGTINVDAVIYQITDPSDERFRVFPGYALGEVDNYIKITALTTYPETQSPGFLIHDAAAAVVKSYGLGETNPFYSELLGSQFTTARAYDLSGCAWRYIVMKGLQVRGYDLSDKPFFMSFEQWWKGINPILCLGLTYDILESSTPDTSTVEEVDDWGDAGGPFPGVSWAYTSPSFPHTSVNGGGGVEGYTCGLCATLSGQTYQFSVVMGVAQTGTETADITFKWALLDASFNEVATEIFSYVGAGFYNETFNMVPSSDGMYLAVRIENNTPTQTKNITIYWAIGGEGGGLLLNPDFASGTGWTNENTGTDWVITGGEATLTLVSGTSKDLTQTFSDASDGHYLILSRRVSTNFNIGPDSVNYAVNVYDASNNLITGSGEFITGNNTIDLEFSFNSVVPIAKIEIVADINTGSDIDLAVPYLYLYGPTGITPPTPEERVIRVEQRDYFYLDEISVNISNIEKITRKYDNDKIFNKIDIGYSQWEAEDISGIDDPQSKRVYATRFQKIGKAIDLKSDFIAASLAIETTRRQTIEKSKDYKFDNNVFIISINPDDVSPDSYLPELGEAFSSVLNLLNSDTRYNIRLSVARNFLRWRKWFNGCLQQYLNTAYRFVGGEGNYDMVSDMIDVSPDCLDEDFDGQPLSEKQDIEVTSDIIHTPNYYEIETPMEWETYKTIRDNRRNAIGISQTASNHTALFIDVLDYEVMNGKAKILGWTKEYLRLEVIEGPAPTQDCFPSTECDNPITDELGEILTDENGVCITA